MIYYQELAERLEAVRERIRVAEARCGRAPGSVTLLAVSKAVAAEQIRACHGLGQHAFGENYLQEALQKIEATQGLPLAWHFIGPLQSNKCRRVAQHFAWAHTIDRLKVARRLSELRPAGAPALNVCIEVNLSGETSKHGVDVAELWALAAAVAALPALRLRGLMTVPAASASPDAQRHPFRRLCQLQESLRERGLALDTLSMGMSGDLEAAIAEGATLVRVGTAIFGPRPTGGG